MPMPAHLPGVQAGKKSSEGGEEFRGCLGRGAEGRVVAQFPLLQVPVQCVLCLASVLNMWLGAH